MVVSWENDDLDAMSSTMTSAEIEQLSAEIQRVSPAFTRLRDHLASVIVGQQESDRVSAFDVVLPDPMPGKGVLLTKISTGFFDFVRGLSKDES